MFTPAAVAAGGTRSSGFAPNMQNAATGLLASDAVTSVLVIGPVAGPPLIANTVAGQTVAFGSAIHPFNGTTVTDPSASPADSAVITVNGGGSLSGPGLPQSGGLGDQTYTVAATPPAALTAIVKGAVFTPAGATPGTSTISLAVSNGSHSKTDSTTTVTVQ